MKNNIFKNLYNYRELLKTTVKKEIRGKYKNSFFGVLWSFLYPLLQITVYAIVFGMILKSSGPNYPIFLCTALIPWLFFSSTVSLATSTIIANGNIIKKVYFPREILPISVVTSGLVNFVISTLIIVGFVYGYGMHLTKYVIWYPVILLIQYILTLGISFIFSSVTVYFRDMEHFVGIALQLLFYATPIVYSMDTIGPEYEVIKQAIYLNPMSPICEAYRDIFYYQKTPDLHTLAIIAIVSVVICIVGYFIFQKLQKRFAEEL